MRLIDVVYQMLAIEDEDGYSMVTTRLDSTFRVTLGYLWWLEGVCGY